MPRPIMPDSAYTHNGDRDFMEALGLKVDGFVNDWTDLGTIILYEADGPCPATTVRVEVSAHPAQFWRFTILRSRDESVTIDGRVVGIYEPRERIVLETGSGGFQDYWGTVTLFANDMLNVTEQGSETDARG